MRGPRLIHLWGPLSHCCEKKMESLKFIWQNPKMTLWKYGYEKNSKSSLECPRSLRLLLPSTHMRSIARICWNLTWLAGTELLTATGKPTEIATIEIFNKTHGLRFFKNHIRFFLPVLKQKHTAPIWYVWRHKGVKTQREDHVATRLPRL